ncbi:hypothetical protein [Ferrovum myxofaciens]|uniref:Uncharacterized protein n=1 Tax=Ferrovum myxofaciens TaxID=416213 RepID=A0A9E6MWW8_9PROT|nr:hypothetical protein [Ferrovum myxofaciens]QKE37432.1 MAG: hypothetical protein HO273_00695 [Ferrovum myxofaciens]QWY75079.1 MAG: hypothetical protein JVY19_01115 [Ferrovum myxofaciens]QWY77815.1 MAG: hypothetical protein JZL65_01625 [Ferrovum myxofaciens]
MNVKPEKSEITERDKPAKEMFKSTKNMLKEMVAKARKDHPMLGWYLLEVFAYSFMSTLVLIYAIIVLIAEFMRN